MDPKQLLLNALSVILIMFKKDLENDCPESPQCYRHIWDFYRACQKYAKKIKTMIVFLDLSNASMHADIHLLSEHFVEMLKDLKDHVYTSATDANPDLTSDHMCFFNLDMKRRLRRLPTTLCDNNFCDVCLAIPRK